MRPKKSYGLGESVTLADGTSRCLISTCDNFGAFRARQLHKL